MSFSIMKEIEIEDGEYLDTFLDDYQDSEKDEVIEFLYSVPNTSHYEYIITEWDEYEDIIEQQRADEWLEDNQ